MSEQATSITPEQEQAPGDGKVVLLHRECSSMVSTWNEYLCIERLRSSKFSLSTCVHEMLGPVHDFIPEDELYDEEGEMVIPETIDGKSVWLEDGEFLMTDTLIEDPGCGPVEFGATDIDAALNFCKEAEWSKQAHFLRVWRRIKDLVRSEGRSPAARIHPMPAEQQPLVNDLVDQAVGRASRRRGFKRLGAWIVNSDWDALVDDGPGGCWVGSALDLKSGAMGLSDADLVDQEGRASRRGLADEDRIRHARSRLVKVFEQVDEGVLTVHAYPLKHSDGTVAFLCGTARVMGQAGPEVEWHGPFKSVDAYLDWLPSHCLVHEDDFPDLTDAEILAAWNRV
jgi:hypothetical protein